MFSSGDLMVGFEVVSMTVLLTLMLILLLLCWYEKSGWYKTPKMTPKMAAMMATTRNAMTGMMRKVRLNLKPRGSGCLIDLIGGNGGRLLDLLVFTLLALIFTWNRFLVL